MKKIILLILMVMLLSLIGCKEQAEPLAITEDGTGQFVEETQTPVDIPEKDDCNIVLCMVGNKEVHCPDEFSECQTTYSTCRVVSCDPELASEVPEEEEVKVSACGETRHLCQEPVELGGATEEVTSYRKFICVGDFEDCEKKYDSCQCGAPQESKCCCLTIKSSYEQVYVSECDHCLADAKCEGTDVEQIECDSMKNTCYYLADEGAIETQYLAPTVVAVTCQDNFIECSARFPKCDCGVKIYGCEESRQDCFKGAEIQDCKDSFTQCLRKNEDCTCGKMLTCTSKNNICYLGDEEYSCNDDYEICVQRYDKCECGTPGSGCSGTGHMCYNIVQDTTNYELPVGEVCDDYYYNCAKKYDWCECKTNEVVDYTCPLKQHTCGDIICTDDYNSCKKKYGDCDCGVTGYVKDLS